MKEMELNSLVFYQSSESFSNLNIFIHSKCWQLWFSHPFQYTFTY